MHVTTLILSDNDMTKSGARSKNWGLTISSFPFQLSFPYPSLLFNTPNYSVLFNLFSRRGNIFTPRCMPFTQNLRGFALTSPGCRGWANVGMGAKSSQAKLLCQYVKFILLKIRLVTCIILFSTSKNKIGSVNNSM